LLITVLPGCLGGGNSNSQIASSERNSVPPCTFTDLSIDLGAQGATQALVPVISVTARTPCRITNFQLRITDRRGKPLDVLGNPASINVKRTLASEQSTSASWFWRNWCGQRRFVLVASAGGLRTTSPGDTPPVCVAPADSSTLILAHTGSARYVEANPEVRRVERG
jgi:hypothetical protein